MLSEMSDKYHMILTHVEFKNKTNEQRQKKKGQTKQQTLNTENTLVVTRGKVGGGGWLK